MSAPRTRPVAGRALCEASFPHTVHGPTRLTLVVVEHEGERWLCPDCAQKAREAELRAASDQRLWEQEQRRAQEEERLLLPFSEPWAQAEASRYKPGDTFTVWAAAPGCGRTVYLLTRCDELGFWGKAQSCTVRELSRWEVM